MPANASAQDEALSPRPAHRRLRWLAPIAGFTVAGLGAALAIAHGGESAGHGGPTGLRLVSLIAVLSFGFVVSGLLGVLVYALLQGSAAALELYQRQVELVHRIADQLEALAASVGRLSPSNLRSSAIHIGRLDEVRAAIRKGEWSIAESLVQALVRDEPESGEATELVTEIGRGREESIGKLKARLEASRSALDPDAVLSVRDELVALLEPEGRKELDRDVVRWLMNLLQRRLRTGTVRADVATLAEKMADRFPETPEGASLRASLPTLRRSAGLCPRCSQPYQGLDEACPACLGPASQAPPTVDIGGTRATA
jgi:hypothetical protein